MNENRLKGPAPDREMTISHAPGREAVFDCEKARRTAENKTTAGKAAADKESAAARRRAKEYLEQIEQLDQLIDSAIEELLYLEEKLSLENPAVTGEMEGEPGAKTTPEAAETTPEAAESTPEAAESAEDIIRLQGSIRRKLHRTVLRREEICAAINTVSFPKGRQTLRCRYVYHLAWQEVADEMGAGKRSVMRWHAKALGEIRIPACVPPD